MRIWNRFYFRLSAVFLILIAFLAVMQARISSDVFDRRRDEIDQRANAMLAADMAREISPYPDPKENQEEIGSAIHYMMVLNPRIEIYLLAPDGTIEAYFADSEMPVVDRSIGIVPIENFLSGRAVFPLYGDDPRRPDRPSTFSVARLNPGDPDGGYLYIILRSSLYDAARTQIAGYYYNVALRRGLLFSLPIVAVLGLMVFFLLTKRLRTLTEVVRAFGNGDHGIRAPDSASDEIGELAGSFNSMAAMIGDSIEALRKAETNRRDLVANISHDLKTPLAAIGGYAETLLEKGVFLDEAKRKSYLETALASVETMRNRVDDLFRLSELEDGALTLKEEPFSLAELCQDVVMQLRPLAEHLRVDLKLEPPEDLCRVNGDISQLERVVANLVENALRFAPVGTEVSVGLARADESIRVSVTDSGPGISVDQAGKVFDRFYTGEPSRTSGHSGLGLAIAKRIVELHDGTIGVVVRPEGGSVFHFSIPSLGS